MKILKDLYTKFINSNFWFHVYYKYTKQHKRDIKRVQDGVMGRMLQDRLEARRKKLFNK